MEKFSLKEQQNLQEKENRYTNSSGLTNGAIPQVPEARYDLYKLLLTKDKKNGKKLQGNHESASIC